MQEATKATIGRLIGDPPKRYERTLKERLEAGEIIRHSNRKLEVATMRKSGCDIVMSGFTGTHRIDFKASDAKRIEAHWNGFCNLADQAKQRSQNGGRR